MLSLSPQGLAFLKAHEGLRLHLYADSNGHATIGYGHLVHRGPPGSQPVLEAQFAGGITPAWAGLLLAKDTLAAQAGVRTWIRPNLAQHEFDALVSFAFNVGVGALSKSTLARRVNSLATPDAIADAWLMWDKPAGILHRRRDELRLFQTGQYQDARP